MMGCTPRLSLARCEFVFPRERQAVFHLALSFVVYPVSQFLPQNFRISHHSAFLLRYFSAFHSLEKTGARITHSSGRPFPLEFENSQN
jgi:hypothetical protein